MVNHNTIQDSRQIFVIVDIFFLTKMLCIEENLLNGSGNKRRKWALNGAENCFVAKFRKVKSTGHDGIDREREGRF